MCVAPAKISYERFAKASACRAPGRCEIQRGWHDAADNTGKTPAVVVRLNKPILQLATSACCLDKIADPETLGGWKSCDALQFSDDRMQSDEFMFVIRGTGCMLTGNPSLLVQLQVSNELHKRVPDWLHGQFVMQPLNAQVWVHQMNLHVLGVFANHNF